MANQSRQYVSNGLFTDRSICCHFNDTLYNNNSNNNKHDYEFSSTRKGLLLPQLNDRALMLLTEVAPSFSIANFILLVLEKEFLLCGKFGFVLQLREKISFSPSRGSSLSLILLASGLVLLGSSSESSILYVFELMESSLDDDEFTTNQHS